MITLLRTCALAGPGPSQAASKGTMNGGQPSKGSSKVSTQHIAPGSRTIGSGLMNEAHSWVCWPTIWTRYGVV